MQMSFFLTSGAIRSDVNKARPLKAKAKAIL